MLTKKRCKSFKKSGQSIIEYCLLFTAVVAALFIASQSFLGSSVNRIWESSANVIDFGTGAVMTDIAKKQNGTWSM